MDRKQVGILLFENIEVLKVVSRYCGDAIARATAKHMEYPFPESNARRISFA